MFHITRAYANQGNLGDSSVKMVSMISWRWREKLPEMAPVMKKEERRSGRLEGLIT